MVLTIVVMVMVTTKKDGDVAESLLLLRVEVDNNHPEDAVEAR
jgi:hypothetical protein